MKVFRIFFVCVLLGALVQAEPIEPLKAYISQLKTADEKDEVAIALLATMHHFLPDKTPQAVKLKDQLAHEFEKKFKRSITEVSERLGQDSKTQEVQKTTFLADAGIELAKYADQVVIKREAELVAQISYVLLSYALSKSLIWVEDGEKALEAQVTKSRLESTYSDVRSLSNELKDTKTTEQLLNKLLSIVMPHQMQGCFAGICLSHKGAIVSLVLVFGLPLAKVIRFFYSQWRAAGMRPANSGEDEGSVVGGDDGNGDDDNDDNNGQPPPAPGRRQRIRRALQEVDELDQQLTDAAGDESSGASSASVRSTPQTPSTPRRRSQVFLPGSPSRGGAHSPFVRTPGARGTVDPVIRADDPRAVNARSRLLGGLLNWSH